MGAWHLAMLASAPFMVTGSKLRTWLALFVAGCAGFFVPVNWIMGYMLADLCAGAVVIRHPAGWQQKFIGALFLMMVVFHVGYLFAMAENGNVNAHLYGESVRGIGWTQAALLITWGLWDAVVVLANRYRDHRRGAVRTPAA